MKSEFLTTAETIEAYIESHLFDQVGLMRSGIDMKTGRPFEREYLRDDKFGDRPRLDTWAYWTYEDGVLGTGLYMDALVRKYEVTGDEKLLERAHQLWLILRNIYSCSQVHGIGSFLRPYGGYEGIDVWCEPLGTDQASPVFAGLYLYMKHAEPAVRAEIADTMLKTLSWYERQNFSYFYYKCFMHEWVPSTQHAASYYLQAIAWAAQETGDPKWRKHLDEKMSLFLNDERYVIFRDVNYTSFLWGSDLPNLAEIMGDQFRYYVTEAKLKEAYDNCLHLLKNQYSEPGYVWRLHPESAEPGFKAFCREPDYTPIMGGTEYFWLHGARLRPWHEVDIMCSLAALGYPGAFEQANELLETRRRVPEDFSYYISDDYEDLPDIVSINARSVGSPFLIQWLRNYWMLRGIEEKAGADQRIV